MVSVDTNQIRSAELVFPCGDINQTLDFYTNKLGFRIDSIYPADFPRVARISGHGLHIRIELCSDPEKHVLPASIDDLEHIAREIHGLIDADDIEIDLAPHDAPSELPALQSSLVVLRCSDDTWGSGRAGMQYRDLIPDRLGGRYISSHIRILQGGPVPDYVHHHHVRFQLIYSYKGWVKVVYEDQGQPFVMHAGDCVLQPPNIRHRVLECSDQMEVIEITCPAEHETLVDHDLVLPTEFVRPDRDFAGQFFVYHEHQKAEWLQGPIDGFESRDLGIANATDDLASALVLRPIESWSSAALRSGREFFFNFVLQGTVTLGDQNDRQWHLGAGDSFAVPAGTEMSLADCAKDLQLLQVASG